MKLPRLYVISLAVFVLLVALLVYRSLVIPEDRVILSNTSGAENGILVVGQASAPMIYTPQTSPTNTFSLGQVTAARDNNEVVAFTNDRAVAIQSPVAWTSGADTVNLPLYGPINIGVTVWVVTGPYLAQHDRAVTLSLAASSIWKDERMGVAFSSVDFHDATSNPSAALYADFNDCNMRLSMQNAIGKDDGRINVYMVDLVQGSDGRGQTCGFGKDFVVIPSNPGDALLAHEMGHDFVLEHVDALTGDFDESNVMHSLHAIGQYFTEGQLFRAHLAPLSTLNWLYHARVGQATRVCPQSTSSAYCPPIAKRIWADGAFGAN